MNLDPSLLKVITDLFSKGATKIKLSDPPVTIYKDDYDKIIKSPLIFISKSFEDNDKEINEYFENILNALNITFITAEKYAGIPIENKVEDLISKCDFLIGIYAKRYENAIKGNMLTSQWLIRETHFAKAKGAKIIILVEEGITDIGGLESDIELIHFSRSNLKSVQQSTIKFLEALRWHKII